MSTVVSSPSTSDPTAVASDTGHSFSPLRLIILAIFLAACIYGWGLLHHWLFLDAFGLSTAVAWTSWSPAYLQTGWQIARTAWQILLPPALWLLYFFAALAAGILIPISFIRLLDELTQQINVPRLPLAGGLAAIYLAALWLALQRIPDPRQLIRSRMDVATSVETLRSLAETLSPARLVIPALFALAGLVLVWTVYRWFMSRLWPWACSLVVQDHPAITGILARLERLPLIQGTPLSPLERRAMGVALTVLILGLPTLFAFTGRLEAQTAMCSGGTLPRIQLFDPTVDLENLPANIAQDPVCTFLVHETAERLYVLRPVETQWQDERPVPVIHQVERGRVQIRRLSSTAGCLTCNDRQQVASLPPLIWSETGGNTSIETGSRETQEPNLEPLIAVDTTRIPLITVVGAGWPAFANIQIDVVLPGAQEAGQVQSLGQTVADETGSFTATFFWNGALPADEVLVRARAEGTNYETTAATRLTLPTLTPRPTSIVAAFPTFTPIPLPTLIPVPTFPTSTPFPTFVPVGTIAFSGGIGAFGPDDFEPDNSAQDSTYMSLGETQTHTFYPPGDVDVIHFRVKKGLAYRVYTHNLSPGVDTKIILKGPAGTCIPANCENDDADLNEILASEVLFMPAEDGIAFVTLINLDQYGEDKRYQITIAGLRPTATPTPSRTPTPSVTPTPSITPTPSNTPLPTATWTPSPLPPTPVPAATPTLAELVPPGNLTCRPLDAGRIQLEWADYSIGETDFRIERSPDQQAWEEIGQVGANSVQFVVEGLAPQTLYWFRVRAHRAGDDRYSDYTPMVGCETLPANS